MAKSKQSTKEIKTRSDADSSLFEQTTDINNVKNIKANNSSAKKTIVIYTDGACFGNPGPGGYAATLVSGDKRKEISGGYRLTTNNRMEILASIEALSTIKDTSAEIRIFSDSELLCNTVNKAWIYNWAKNGWRKSDKSPVLNVDLWKRLIILLGKFEDLKFSWVKGHANIPENERCDVLSKEAASGSDLAIDSEYEISIGKLPKSASNLISTSQHNNPIATNSKESTNKSNKILKEEFESNGTILKINLENKEGTAFFTFANSTHFKLSDKDLSSFYNKLAEMKNKLYE
jgi:ribonuclease HI